MSANTAPSQPPTGDPPVRIPPLVVGIVIWLLMWIGARALPTLGQPSRWTVVAAIVCFAAGATIAVAGLLEFRRARTTSNPLRPDAATGLVTSGIYRLTRNPMYVGFACLTLGWAAYLGHALAPLGVVAFVAWISRFQIPPEERALAALFGDAFDRYRSRVRRWI